MSFINASLSIDTEIKERLNNREGLLSFGLDFLDDAAAGIMRNDLILVGAHSGGGKTQFCCNVALANISRGKRVHYIALEAERFEIERRIRYQAFSRHFFEDPDRPEVHINFQEWMLGDFSVLGASYEALAADEMREKYKNLFIYNKQDSFDVLTFIEKVVHCAAETDLIIVDHVHYFDFDDENENRAIREIAKTARTLTLEQGKPMILVSHMRKRDRNNGDLVPGMEEFHGSSDLFKIATKAITLAPGNWTPGGKMETYFRIVKNRFEGAVTRFVASTVYSTKEGIYEKGYRLADANCKRDKGFIEIETNLYPTWARNRRVKGSGSSMVADSRRPLPSYSQRGTRFDGIGSSQD